MLAITIPGFKELALGHLVLDYNGTMAVDGVLVPGVAERLAGLSEQLEVHVVTADTFGKVEVALAGIVCHLTTLRVPLGAQDVAKLHYVERLGADTVVAIGNGRNDRLMLQAAAVGIAVVGPEGAASAALASCDIVAPGILAALDSLLHPLRLVATLRA